MTDQILEEDLYKKIADLRIQSMMFDMDIDWETLELVEKKKPIVSKTPWLDKWIEKLNNSDHMPDGSDQQGWE